MQRKEETECKLRKTNIIHKPVHGIPIQVTSAWGKTGLNGI